MKKGQIYNVQEFPKKFPNFRGARKIEVLEIEVLEGQGIHGEPYRIETYYCRLDGEIIYKRNSLE